MFTQVAARALEMAKEADLKQRVNGEKGRSIMEQFIVKVILIIGTNYSSIHWF